MVGMVIMISASFRLYRIVVFPAASRPTMRMHISFLPKRPLERFAKVFLVLVDESKLQQPETPAVAALSQALIALPQVFYNLGVTFLNFPYSNRLIGYTESRVQ